MIEIVDKVYGCSKNAFINWHSIKFTEFQVFTQAVQRLINVIGELDDGDDWYSLVKSIRGFRFSALAAPLSEDCLQEQLRALIDRLRIEKERFCHSQPNAMKEYSELLEISEGLKKTELSRLLSSLSDELSQYKGESQTVVLVCETRFVQDSEKALVSAGFPKVVVASSSFLREDIVFRNLIVIGPTRWFPAFIFSAPRAENLLILKYAWIRDKWKHQNVFAAPLKQRASKLMQMTIDEPPDNLSIEPETLKTINFDFQRFERRVMDENRGHHEVDYVQARLFLLEEDWMVLLDADETSSVHVIDLKEPDSLVKKIKVDGVEPGMYMLLRTAGGGDFIVQVADQVMGESGVAAREHQRKWKSLLRSQVIQHGYEKVLSDLRQYGSTRANHANVRNWMSERSIKTEYRNDFDAIMKLVNLKNEKDQYWRLMEHIDHAHRKAGHNIRKMLLDKVMHTDLRSLKRTGKLDFELDSENNIYITAFQVKNISPEKMRVLPSQLGNPVRQSD